MKAASLMVLFALLFTLLTSEGGCEDKSATGGRTATTNQGTRGSTQHSSRVPVNGAIGILLAAGLGLGAITIIKRNRKGMAGDL
jgi:hypothetical protein